ncbi:MAG: hypothetical protein GY754_20480 [bacterium]|nr:hypothetical protein [bacterium]
MKESTRKMLKQHGWRIDLFIHGYIYFVFYSYYNKFAIFITTVLRNVFWWFKPLIKYSTKYIFNRYHGKVLTRENTGKILALDEDIRVISEKNKKIIPYAHSTKIIFENPSSIVVMDCPCKLASNAPCRPVSTCIAIGDPIASFWLESCKRYHPRKISQQEALDLIKELRKTGHFQQVFSKKSSLGQTYAICNCCKHCCSAHSATRLARIAEKSLTQIAPSGYSVKWDKSKCQLCGKCEKICSFDCYDLQNRENIYQKERCVGCELCVEHCPNGALSIYFDEERNILPFDIDIIKQF